MITLAKLHTSCQDLDEPKNSLEKCYVKADDAEFGYIVCVDLDYPDSIHDAHQDFPMTPTREPVDSMWLSSYQMDLLNFWKNIDEN